MDRARLAAAVNGGYIDGYELDLRKKVLALRVDVLNETLRSYDLRFELVSYFQYDTDSRREEDARLQLTELWLDAGPEGSPTEEWEVTISIFDLSHIRLRCSTITIEGKAVR
jgi:hypothetical protein